MPGCISNLHRMKWILPFFLLLSYLSGAQPLQSVKKHNRDILALYERMMDSTDTYLGFADIHPRHFYGPVQEITFTSYMLSGDTTGQYRINYAADSITWYFDEAGHDTADVYHSMNRFYKTLQKKYTGMRLGHEIQMTGNPARPNYADMEYHYNRDGLLEQKTFTVRGTANRTDIHLVYTPQGNTTVLYIFSLGAKGDSTPRAKMVYNADGLKLAHIDYSFSGRHSRSLRYQYGSKGQLVSLVDSNFLNTSRLEYLGYEDTIITQRNFYYQRNRLCKATDQMEVINWAREEIPRAPQAGPPSGSGNADVVSEMPPKNYRFFREPTEKQPVNTTLFTWTTKEQLRATRIEGHKEDIQRYEYTCDSRGNWVEVLLYSGKSPSMLARRAIIYRD